MGTELYLGKGEKSLTEGETENMHSGTLYIMALSAIFIYLSIVGSGGRWRQLSVLHTVICPLAEKEQVEEISCLHWAEKTVFGEDHRSNTL